MKTALARRRRAGPLHRLTRRPLPPPAERVHADELELHLDVVDQFHDSARRAPRFHTSGGAAGSR